MPTAAPTTSTQLDREQIAADLIGEWVTYVGRIGSAHGHRFQVTAAYSTGAKGPAAGDTAVTLTREGEDRPALSFVRLSSIEVVR